MSAQIHPSINSTLVLLIDACIIYAAQRLQIVICRAVFTSRI